MDDSLIQLIRTRAAEKCEYCLLPQATSPLRHQIDHIIASKHDGPTSASNLSLACFACNNHKGANIAGIDPATGAIVRLFNPRRHKWSRHFRWKGAELIGKTPIGRATVRVLEINLLYRTDLRKALMDEGVYFETP